ncbi:MAG: efflux RND transporter permease subunit, partial [Solirubrobacterales bacterium]|nr:efflux RND transporter permease subunit [Solirubrobacterales bacterium]
FLHQPAAPRFKDRNLVVQWDGPAGTALSEMDRVTARAIAELRALPAVANVAATLGQAVSADQVVDTNSGQLYVTIKPSANYDGAASAVRSIVEGTPGIRASVSTYEADVTSGVLAPANHQVTVRVYGEDYGVLAQLGGRVSSLLSRIHGVGTPRMQMPTQQPNIGISIQDAAALNAGVLPGDARREASTLVYRLTVGNFFQNQAVFDVTVSGIPSEVSTLNQVRNLLLDTSNGGHVRLDQVAQVKVEPDPVDIQHEALSRYLDVTAAVPGADVGSVQSAITGELGQVHYPLGYHAEVVGGTPNDPTSHVAFLSYVLVAAVGVFLLLQAALRSWRLAAALFLALPVALLGGILVALLTGQLDSVGTDAGLVAVFALAARQGTVLIAHLRRLQARDGGPLTPEIVIRGASERFAPTIGAVFVTAAALIPFAVMGDVAGNELTHTAAAVMLGGILGATALNLLLVPAVCLAVGPLESVAGDEPGEVPSLAASTPSSSLEEA